MKWGITKLTSLNFQRESITRKRRMESLMTTLRQCSIPLNHKSQRNVINIKVLSKRPLNLPRQHKQRNFINQTNWKWSWSNKQKQNIKPYWKSWRRRKKSMKLKYEMKQKLNKTCTTLLYPKLFKMLKNRPQSLLPRRRMKRKKWKQPKNLRRSTRRRKSRIIVRNFTGMPWTKEVKTQNCTQSLRN